MLTLPADIDNPMHKSDKIAICKDICKEPVIPYVNVALKKETTHKTTPAPAADMKANVAQLNESAIARLDIPTITDETIQTGIYKKILLILCNPISKGM